jgi:hypothetical protein
MADEKDRKSLEMRLTKLEDAIAKLVQIRKTADISAEELKTYLKVRDVVEDKMCFCVPRPAYYSCYRCVRCYCYSCINECNCGPCGRGASGGFGGFSELGG